MGRRSIPRGCLLYLAGSFLGLLALGLIAPSILSEAREHPGAIIAAQVVGVAGLVAVSAAFAWRRQRARRQPPR